MVLRPGRATSAELEALSLYSRLDPSKPGAGLAVRDLARREKFYETIRAKLDASLDNPSRLHGWRVQGLFEAMIVCLGRVRLIKEEDIGQYYADDADGELRPPDFRIVADDSEQLLVEVKAVSPADSLKPWRMRETDLPAHLQYAQVTRTRLLFAHYWSGWNLWTLVDAATLVRCDEKTFQLGLPAAIMANELGLLGDAEIGTTPPLVLSLIAGPGDQCKRELDNGYEYKFTVSATELSCAGTVLTDPREQRIAWFLMLNGTWPAREDSVVEKGQLVRIDYVCSPPEPEDDQQAQSAADQGFSLIGSLSSLYSRLYNDATLTDSGDVRELRQQPDPGSLAALVPANYWDHGTDHALPIWKFTVQPR